MFRDTYFYLNVSGSGNFLSLIVDGEKLNSLVVPTKYIDKGIHKIDAIFSNLSTPHISSSEVCLENVTYRNGTFDLYISSSIGTGMMDVQISSLKSNHWYSIKMDSHLVRILTTDSIGNLTIKNGIWSIHRFTVEEYEVEIVGTDMVFKNLLPDTRYIVRDKSQKFEIITDNKGTLRIPYSTTLCIEPAKIRVGLLTPKKEYILRKDGEIFKIVTADRYGYIEIHDDDWSQHVYWLEDTPAYISKEKELFFIIIIFIGLIVMLIIFFWKFRIEPEGRLKR
jgi:hypothetical protein